MVTASDSDHFIYRIANGQPERQDPPGFTLSGNVWGSTELALAPDGTVHLGALTKVGGEFLAIYGKYAAGVWSTSLVYHGFAPVTGLEVGSDGAPRMWLKTTPTPPYGTSMAIESPAGAWTIGAQAVPSTTTDTRFTLASNTPVPVAFNDNGTQLLALVSGVARNVGSPISNLPDFDFAVTAPPAPNAVSGPLFAAVVPHADGIHVVGESAIAPETEVSVVGTSPLTPVCPAFGSATPCGGTCHETASGLGLPGFFALARTDDGTAWLAYATTQLNQTITYALESWGGSQMCRGSVTSDNSTSTLHLVRIRLDGSAPTEVLTIPIDSVMYDGSAEPHNIDIRGFGTDLAVGLRTVALTPTVPVPAVRILRIDTTKL